MVLLGELTGGSRFEDVAEAIVREAARRGYDQAGQVAALSTAIQESGLRPGIRSPNGAWIGLYQQDGSYSDRDNPNANISQFFDRLDVKCKSSGASPDMWKNIFWLQQRPGESTAELAYRNGRQNYLLEIQSRADVAKALVVKFGGAVADGGGNRPDFNEYANWSPNNSPRGGVKVDLFLLHTQEGGGGDDAADDLGRYLADPASQVSYHYTGSQASDGGTTVVDCVDTDFASWSVLDANARSINFCFAGSRASQSRDEWLSGFSKVIDVAAYLAVQDAQKYGFEPRVIKPPYGPGPGISDHKYVTEYLKIGTHTDLGPNFPWDYFESRVAFWAAGGVDGPVAPVESPKSGFEYPSTDEMVKQIWEQLFGPEARGWPSLFGLADGGQRGKFAIEALADLHKAAA